MPGKAAAGDEGKRCKPRRYSTGRLMREPVTVSTCQGALVIGAEKDAEKGVFRVTLTMPELDMPPGESVTSP